MKQRDMEAVKEVMRLRHIALTAVYLASAKDITDAAVAEALKLLRIGKYTISTYDGIADQIIEEYAAGLNQGGTMCVERILTPSGEGFIATTARQFVPWLSDMEVRESAEIIDLIGQSEQAGVYPLKLARQLEEYFADSAHNAVTAARTEAQKIRSDARSEMFKSQGVEYVEYVTAGDEKVRPEHRLRDGKIYRHEDAPWLGEYNCRCVLVPADYKVEKGADVTASQDEYITKEEAERQ